MRRSLVACLICAIALIVAPNSRAYAIGDYSIDELSTQVTAQADAAVHVIERQTLTFSDYNAGVVWYLHAPEDEESVHISSVRFAPVDNGGTLLGDWTRMKRIHSSPQEQGRNPGDTAAASLRMSKTQPWYSYNANDGMVRCFFPTGDAAARASAADTTTGRETDGSTEIAIGNSADFHTYLIETDYTVANRVRVFRDVGELYWRYAHETLKTGASDVSLQVILPVPPGADPATVSENVSAWGHGPDAGTFSASDDGTVTYTVDEVSQGNYAEAHVIFPASWLVDVPDGDANQFSELRGPDAIAEESEWVDVALRETTWDNMVRMTFLIIALIVIVVGVIGVIRHDRSPLSRRALVRTATTLGVMALGVNLFFREPMTTAMLAMLALIVLAASLMLPSGEGHDNLAQGLSDDLADASPENPDRSEFSEPTDSPEVKP